ncbi:hypothetical protein [Gottfriedia solisilvae]|uniref:hypothetical protein n=1 Tax=Gottfriedia solisilvae TaxID=1516104 RepID=UPI003D2EA22E
MKFEMSKFSYDEITNGTKLAEEISSGFTTEDRNSSFNPTLIKIEVAEWDDETNDYVLNKSFKWLENHIGNNTEIWICWEEDEGEISSWWITGNEI